MTTRNVETHVTEREPGTQSPVKKVSAIRTGIAAMHAQHLEGSRLNPLLWVFFGRKWITDRPLSVFVIEHEKGLVLFDAGMNTRVKTDPNYWPDRVTRAINNKVFRFEIGSEDTLTRQLELAGYAASDVSKAVISHLHFDHVGCIEEIPQAELLVSAEAWKHMLTPHAVRKAVLRRDIEIPGARWTQLTLEPTEDEAVAPFTEAHDVMGDGSMMLIPTPGHMPGSVSMLVRTDPAILFVGDLCYSLEGLLTDRFPGIGEKDELAESYAKVRELRERNPGMLVVPAHDPEAVKELKAHPLYSAQAKN